MKIVTGKHLVAALKEEGVEVAEETLHQIEKALFSKALPAVVADPEASVTEKGAAGLLLSMYPVLKPQLAKSEDLNNDGHVGVVD